MNKPLAIVAALLSAGANDCNPVLEDPGFDLWCGDALCSWKLVRGEVRKAPTWHAADLGVEFAGADTAIQQVSDVTSADGTCLEFSMISDVRDDAQLVLEIDAFGDGTVERAEAIPATEWERVTLRLRFDGPYERVRFALAKRGPGHAVLAQLDAELVDGECTAAFAIVPCRDPSGTCD
jgi:hypothetical protein